ncbi:MAG: ABC transporter substrate-binding protein [Hyphomicrobiales bacterium]|nr:ABC transporter substrate-binding protein [Hyphomicrobiales bacterium]
MLGAAAIMRPREARAQIGAMPRIGYVWIGASGTDISYAGLLQGLADRGYVRGRNFVLEDRYADGDPERVPSLIAELLTLDIAVLVTPGTPTSLAAKRATSTVPIVSVTGDPVGVGLAASLSRPGGNVTGLSVLSGDYSSKWPQLLKEAVPALHSVKVLLNPENSATKREMQSMKVAAQALGLDVMPWLVRTQDIESSLAALAAMNLDGVIVTDDPLLFSFLPRIIALTAERRVPALYAFSTAVRQGGFMSYSANFFEIWRRAAGYIDRILKGARPGDLPIEQATEITLGINLTTAKALGVSISSQLLASADEIVE